MPRPAVAATNSTVNFQARLMRSAGSIVADGDYNAEFKLYNTLTSSGSSQGSCTGDSACLWTETRTSTNKVRVVNGYLTVDLGSVTAFPTTINWDQNLYISLNIGGTAVSPTWDGEMSPRLKLTAVPYAFRAGQLATVNGSFTSTVGFVQPTANRSILAPDESGTICLQNSANCGFALSSGSGSYIQNGTSLQSGANFNISGTGTAATSLQAPLLDAATSGALNIGTTNATAINLNKSTTITGGITQSAGVISLAGNAASSITTSTGALTLTAAATSSWTVGGTNQSLTITTSGTGTLTLGTTGAGTVTVGSSSLNVNVGTTNVAHNVHIADGGTSTNQIVTIGSTNTGSTTTIQGGTSSTAINLTAGTNGSINLTATGTGTNLIKSAAGTVVRDTSAGGITNAFQVQNTGGGYILNVDTQNNIVNLGYLVVGTNGSQATVDSYYTAGLTIGATTAQTIGIGNTSAAVTIQGTGASVFKATSGSFTSTLAFANPAANATITIPNATGTVCLQSSASCGFAPASGSANYIQNTTTAQSANLYVQAATSGTVAGTFQANAAGSGDILDLKSGSGSNVATVGSTGATAFQNSANSTSAFQVQNVSGNQLLNVDTTNSNVTLNTGASQLGPWKASTSLPQSLQYSGSASANGFVYAVAGFDGAYKNTVYFAQQNSDGSIGSWQSGTSLPAALLSTSVTIANNYIYVVGGQSSSSRVATVYYATINPSTGVVGAWTTSANSLPVATAWGSATVANGYLYFAGGYDGTSSTTAVYYSALNAGTGANGAFTTSPNSLPAGRDSGALTVSNNYLYFSGGVNGTPTSASVFYAPINAGTGAISSAWSTASNSLPNVRALHGMVAANGYLYAIGGEDDVSTQYTTYYSKLGATGIPGSWAAGTSLPTAEAGAAVSIATNGYIYVIGGYNGTNVSYVYYASTQNITSVGGNLTASGSMTIQSTTNAANTLQVQNSAGWQLFNVNASDNVISLNANSSMNGASTQWTTSSYLPVSYDGSSSVTVNGTIYYIGGYDGTNYVSDVYYARTSGSGSTGSWKTGNSLPSGRAFASAVTVNGYIYVMGGNASGTYSNAVYYAKVNADGSLGAWQTTTSLTAVRAYGAATASNGYIYYVGGRSNGTTYQSTIYYAAPNPATGAISSWTTSANAVPATRALHTVVAANNYLYVMGGTSDGTTFSSNVYYSALNTSTGAPAAFTTSGNNLPAVNGDSSAVVSGGYAYIFGGYNGTSVNNAVYYAVLNSNGTTGVWQTMAKALPENVNFGASTAVNGYLYVLGGYNGSYFLNTVYTAAQQGSIAISGNTSIAGNASFSSSNSTSAFQIQNASGNALFNVDTSNNIVTLNGGVGAVLTPWQQTSSLSATTSFGAATIMNGYAYTFGGYGSGYTSTVQYAPINGNGTMGTWSTTSALPAVRGYISAVSATGYVYVIGGSDGSTNQNTIYIAKQNSDGTLGTWLASSVTLPTANNALSAVAANGYLYILGGNVGGSAVTTVSYAHINGDGSLNSFVTGTSLPVALANASAVVANGYIYFMGGFTGSTAVSTVYYSALNASDGSNGAWNTTSALPGTGSNYSATVMNGNLYYFRGSSTYYAQLNSNGTVGAWTTDSNAIPNGYNGTSAINYNGYIYILGGYTGSVGTTGIYYTSGARTMIMGSLDLVGLTAVGSLTGDTPTGGGSVGGALTAGNTTVVGTLQVQGQSTFNQAVAINGNSLTVGNNLDSSSTGNTLITVQSRGFAGLELYGDSTNDNTAEGGGAYVLYSTDGILGTEAITGLVQQADVDPSGTAYTGAVGNDMLIGTRSNFGLQFGTNTNVRMVLTNAGNLCIGLTACTHKLAVNGQIYSTSATITTGTPDIAETIGAADDVEAMDVVMADPDNTERAVKANTAYNSQVIGVVSDGTSGFLIDHLHYGQADDPNDTSHRVPLTLAGRVYVKVSGQNGAIKPGDYLTTSDKPGYAMKAVHAGPTIGKALGYFDGDTGKVLVLVNLGYYNPASDIQGTNEFQNINVSGNITVNGGLTVKGATNVGTITIDGHIITAGDAPQLQVLPAAGQNATATINGNDTSGTIVITTGSGVDADDLLKLVFAKMYDANPHIVISPVGKDSAFSQAYVDQITKNDFMIGIGNSLGAGKVYTLNYQIMQ